MIYVDCAAIPATVGRLTSTWSHLTADEQEELHDFAARLGLRRAYFQTCRKNRERCPPHTCPHWHYDLSAPKREQALRMGAQEVDPRQLGEIIAARRVAQRSAPRALVLVPDQPAAPDPVALVQRPAGRGRGLDGPACPERLHLDQSCVLGPRQSMCIRCGRVTARKDTDGKPWCGGDIPAPAAVAAAPVEAVSHTSPQTAKRQPKYTPNLQRHTWTKPTEHHRRCGFCGLHVVNQSTDHRTWWQTWTWPSGETGTNQGSSDGRLPKCPGPDI
jgi:hypothetical protein